MHRFASIACLGALVAATVRAENIDLSTVPSRDTVQLTIYNSEDITLVRETRKVTFKKKAPPCANLSISPKPAAHVKPDQAAEDDDYQPIATLRSRGCRP